MPFCTHTAVLRSRANLGTLGTAAVIMGVSKPNTLYNVAYNLHWSHPTGLVRLQTGYIPASGFG